MNLTPFLRTLKIRDKNRNVIPFEPNWAQARLIEEVEKAERERRPARIIVLKARQLGISTVTEGILFAYAATTPNTNAVVVAHDGGSSEHLFGITKHFYETWEFRESIPHRYATKRQLSLDGVGSSIHVMTAENTEAGRSRTIQVAHFSEMGFWTEPAQAMTAFNNAIPPTPGTLVVIESTANGMGNFFEEQWLAAKAGETDYVPMFFPWWEHYEYIPCQGFVCTDGTCPTCVEAAKITPADDEERHLVKIGCDLPHLAWRRWAIPNRCMSSVDLFHQEFPSTDDEAFLVSGVNAFPETHLREVYEPAPFVVGSLAVNSADGSVRFVQDPSGPLRLYKKPWSRDGQQVEYFIGADPCYGADPERGGDWAAAQVINRHNHEQVAVWHGRINPIAFADELVKLGRFFNEAMISVETDGPGYGTIGRLTGLYPNIWHHRTNDKVPGRQKSSTTLSWQTNWRRKTELVTKLAEAIERRDLILHDARTYKELRGYTFYGRQGYGTVYGPASKEQHDDLVMSLGIAIVCESKEPKPVLEPRPPKFLEDIDHVYGEDFSRDPEEAWSAL